MSVFIYESNSGMQPIMLFTVKIPEKKGEASSSVAQHRPELTRPADQPKYREQNALRLLEIPSNRPRSPSINIPARPGSTSCASPR